MMADNVTISRVTELSDDLRRECYYVIGQSQPQMAEKFYHQANAELRRGGVLVVAATPRMVVGCMFGRVFCVENVYRATLEYNFVDKKYRNRGIGAQMLAAYENYARKNHNVYRIDLKSSSSAIPFYKRHGYTAENGCFMHKFLVR